MNTNKHHASKTFQSRPACAGSGAIDPEKARYSNYLCPVCGRTDIGLTAWSITHYDTAPHKLNTHLHEDDLARNSRKSAPAPQPQKTKEAHVFTPEQHEAIKAFFTNENADTYKAMLDSGLEANSRDTSKSYVQYARKQGWTA